MAINFLKNSIYIFFICLIAPLWGQTQKKYVTEEEYEQWTSMSAATLSPNGTWVYYTLSNIHIKGLTQPSKPADTLELAELKNMKKYIYPLGHNPQFAPNGEWFSFFQNDQWVLFDLTNKTETRTDSIQSAQFVLRGAVTLIRHTNHPDKLTVYNNKNKSGLTINHTKDFSISPDKENMVILQQNENLFSLLLLDLKNPNKPTLLKENLNNCSNFRWSDSGNLVAFYEETKSGTVDYKDHQLQCINLKDRTKDKILYSENIKGDFYLNKSSIVFTSDEKSINLTAFPINNTPETINPVIWRSSDPVQPPKEIVYPTNNVVQWTIKNGVTQVMGKDNFSLLASGNLKHFFLLDNTNYLPAFQFKNFYCDIYNLNDYKKQYAPIEKAFVLPQRTNAISMSPSGKYMAWIKEKQWVLYNIDENTIKCITCGTNDTFSRKFDDNHDPFVPFNSTFFSSNNKTIVLTAQNNIYLYDIEKDIINPIFPNHDNSFSYTIEYNRSQRHHKGVFYTFGILDALNLQQGVFIIQYNHNTQQENLYFYQKDKKPLLITSSPHKISSPRKAGNTIIYTLSNYSLPPQIVYWKNSKETVIKQSNQQQQDYYWGHSKLLTYPGPYGTKLKGALFYPGNYNPNRKYPVLIQIYSDISTRYLKAFIPLTLQNGIGWNNSRFTSNDYFVFMPDISYKINYTGESALKSVLAGVNAISKIPGADTDRIGLFGQSFGGYEVSYIATQTDRFKTIISFAGSHDLVDTYLNVNDTKQFTFWKFEQQQYRIKVPYYSQTFLDNSPILQTYKINTPMLLIAGTNDKRVDWKNSVKMQLALTRFGKRSTLLLYKDENHVFTEKHNQIDVSKKLLEWCDYHLKGKSVPKWN